MLLRAYRLTDKLGLVFLKTSTAFTQWTLSGATIATSSTGGVFGVVGAVLSKLFGGVWRALRWLLSIVWKILGAIGGVILGFFNIILRTFSGGSERAVRSAGKAANTSMARRAARAEMEVGLAEDPLRAQNRVLSGFITVLLFILVGFGLWATNPSRGGNNSLGSVADLAGQGASLIASPALPTVAVLPSPVPTTTPLPEFLEVRGTLAYVVRENGQDDIWAVSVGGNRTPIRLTNDPADDRDPAWSPDGSKLAFASRREGNWDIYILDIGTMQTTRVTYGLEFQGAPTWSPDGVYLAYESYQGDNLDIYVQIVDFSNPPQRITSDPAPDFSPAWSPEPSGRRIAFVSWRNGNQDIYVYSLDRADDTTSVNITNTPSRQEDYPSWRGPDGDLLTYSAREQGLDLIFVQPDDASVAPQIQPTSGHQPSWSPDGASIVFASDFSDSTQLIASPFAGSGSAATIVSVQQGARDPSWTSIPLPASLVNAGGVGASQTSQLYIEQASIGDNGLYTLGSLVGVEAQYPFLSDRVNDSFNALRQAAASTLGYDFLGTLEDALWQFIPQMRPPQFGEERLNWHYTGRAFAINRNLPLGGFPPPVEIVREDIGVNVYWRVYVRVDDAAQSGQLGEPLRHMPWDLASRGRGDVQAYNEGGRLRTTMPSGYYIDLTQLAADYGWGRLPAGTDWRANTNAANYWMFVKTDGLDWTQAMLEIYNLSQLGGFAPTNTPAPTLVITTTAEGG
jgi:TolB protein